MATAINKDGLNETRAKMLRKLFIRRDRARKEEETLRRAIFNLGAEYSKNAGYIVPLAEYRLRNEVFEGVKEKA
jgi:hypothetical protein